MINLAGKHPNFQFHNRFSSVKVLVGAFNKERAQIYCEIFEKYH